MSFARILSTGISVPDKVLSNFDFEKIVDTSDEWIRTRTGIVERRIAEPDVATSDLAYEASLRALDEVSLDPGDIDGIVVGTATPDHLFPSTACILQSELGAKRAFAFDILAGCSGYLYALQTAKSMIASGDVDNVLVVGAEVLSRIVDYEDRTTCILFGDGAGASLLSKADTPGILSICLGANGDNWKLLHMPGGGSRIPATLESVKNREHFLKMSGRDVFKEAIICMEAASAEAIKKADITLEEIDLFIFHQANYRILDAVRKRLDIPSEKVFSNLDRYGNTSSASVPIALDEALTNGRIDRGDTVLLAAFGAGFTWGASVIRW